MDLPATETVSPRYADLDSWPSADILGALWDAQMEAVACVRPALQAIERAAEAAHRRLGAEGRLIYAGAGTSGRIGAQDGAELPPTFDWPPSRLVLLVAGGDAAFTSAIENAEDRADLAHTAVAEAGVQSADVVIGVAASGTTPYTIACVEAARGQGALTIGIANSPAAPLLLAAEHAILLETGPEAIAGSTRLKAGTAQKVALNLFSTLLMTRLGRVYRGQMVDMLARNDKLRRRAVRMLTVLTQAAPEQAEAALAEAGGKVKTAVLVLRGLTPAEAEALLSAQSGQLRSALDVLSRR